MGMAPSRLAGAAPGSCAGHLHDLQEMWPKVVTLPTEEQACYADTVCGLNAHDPDWSLRMLESVRKGFPHSPPDNTTGVGNLAYMALNGPEEHREEWKTVHLAYTLFLKRQHGFST